MLTATTLTAAILTMTTLYYHGYTTMAILLRLYYHGYATTAILPWLCYSGEGRRRAARRAQGRPGGLPLRLLAGAARASQGVDGQRSGAKNRPKCLRVPLGQSAPRVPLLARRRWEAVGVRARARARVRVGARVKVGARVRVR